MSTHEKFKNKITSKPVPTDISFEKLKSFLQKEGFVCVDGKGDHYKFSHPDLNYHISIDSGAKGVKAYSIIDIRKAIEEIKRQNEI